jgi:fucose 4-O-acetylase-like acetyltransferase
MQANAHRGDIDTMRGIDCMLLVFFHVVGDDSSRGLRLPGDHPLSLINLALSYFRMPMFAFLSGVVYALRPFEGDYGRFVSGKVRRLLVPMLIVGTLFALVQPRIPGTNMSPVDWRTIHLIPYAHFWFLESMFLIFIVVMALEGIGALRRQAVLIAVVLAAGFASARHVGYEVRYFGVSGAVYLFPYFLIGLWFTRFGSRVSRIWLCGVSVVAIAGLGLNAARLGAFPDKQSVLASLASATFCIALLSLGLRNKALERIGFDSFPIYLFHPVFTGGARVVLRACFGDVPLGVLVPAGELAGVTGPMVLAWLLRSNRWGCLVIGESYRPRERAVTGNAPA